MTDKNETNGDVPEIIAQILARRGLVPADMADFLYPNYDNQVHDPYLLTDMAAAVDRIELAARTGERVVVYGDYDIDGITASAVLLEGLAANGIAAESYIPDRFDEGYGINQEALAKLQAEGVQLVISVDCGITSRAEAAWAREHGLDLIITDHHSVPELLPEAVAVVNPKRPGDAYPFKELAGVGVAFKLVQALQQRTGCPRAGQEKWLLDLVAFGTVGDVVPLVAENRVLVRYGLAVMRQTRRLGLRALAAVGGFAIDQATAYHLGYVLGPRLNAAGRLEHAGRSLELMRTSQADQASYIAEELDQLNQRRRADQEAIVAAAEVMAEQYANDPVLVLAHPDWSHGVVGIVASKLAGKWRKPTLVAQILGEATKGSARSVPGFNMVEALRGQADILTRFGGHVFAAGYTLPTSQLDHLRQGLIEWFNTSPAAQSEPTLLSVDAELADLETLDWRLLADLELLEPIGSGNPRPLFRLNGLSVEEASTMGKAGQHLRLRLRDGVGRRVTAVGFDLAQVYPALKPGQKLVAVGELNQNEYQGTKSIQIIIRELEFE